MKLESIITLILGLAIGAVLGHVAAVRTSPDTKSVPAATRLPLEEHLSGDSVYDGWPSDAEMELPNFSIEERPLLAAEGGGGSEEPGTLQEAQQQNRELQQQVYELFDWIDANLPSGEPRSPDNLKARGMTVLTDDGKLNPEIAAILNISGPAYDGVSEALARAYAAMVELRQEKMNVRQRRDRGLQIRIAGLEEEGTVLRAELERALQAQLGNDLYDSFMQSTWSDLEKQFFYFGQGHESLRFRSYTDRGTGEPRMWYQSRYYFPQGEGSMIIYQHNGSSSSVPPEYEQYIEWERPQ